MNDTMQNHSRATAPHGSSNFVLSFGVVLLAALVPLLLFAVLATAEDANLQEIAQRTAKEYDRLIRLREQQVFTFAAFPSIRAFTASTPETRSPRAAVALNELQSLVASDTGVREAFLTDQNGIVIMTTQEGWGGDMSKRQFVQDALAGHLIAAPVAHDKNEYSNYYAAPVLNNRGDVAGALALRVAAQELWEVSPRGAQWYAVLSDENGVRLDDTGDPARRMASFGALDTTRAARIVNEQTYGAQMPQVRATAQERAQQLITQGALDQLRASDFGASALGYQRLVSKPWTVFVLAPQPAFLQMLPQMALAILVAVAFAFGGAFVLTRV
jgi:C4-dicarboxylate-specific signal transduction histidine kinase